ncbi:MAG: zinc ribbon domain-containing protein [Firmicutes bacterium]|nr:zinc ribbon domain-containing protein [Bacillota bacterium]
MGMNKTESVCQSCAMPHMTPDQLGTEADGSLSQDYCKHCYQNGKFVVYNSLEDAIADSVNYAKHAGLSEEQMLQFAKATLPGLKRWKS